MKTSTLLFVLIFAFTARAAEKPNIIVIYADDMGYGDCTVNNPESKIPTPNIDRLAKEGMRFTDAHSPSSTCTASRYGLLTGTCPVRRGVVNGLTGLGPVIDKDEVTVADFLKNHGYVTRMIGKWHLGFEMYGDGPRKTFDFSKPLVGGPLDCGFDSFFGLTKAPSGPPYFYIRGREPAAKPTETTPGTKRDLKANGRDSRTAYAGGDIATGFVPEECNAAFSDEAVKIVNDHAESDQGKPLFLYHAMLEPHVPWLPGEEFAGKSKAGSYGDYIEQLDYEVGRVLAALNETGLE
jgi:arylsulfatase A